MKKIIALILSAMMIVTLFVGCGDAGTTGNTDAEAKTGTDVKTETTGTENTAAAEEKVLHAVLNEDPDTFDTALYAQLTTLTVLRNIQEGLVKNWYHDGDYEMIPGDAERWEVSEDGLDYTFYLREDAKWADGEPITAQQYVYGIQRIVDPKNAGPQSFMIDSIKNYSKCLKGELPVTEIGAKALDDHTLVLSLETPFSGFLQTICGSIVFPVREEFIENWGEKYGTEAQYVGCSGPFVLDEWVHNSKIVLKKNENYWNKETVFVDKVEFMITAENNTVYNAFQSGDLDFVSTYEQEWIDLFSSDPHNKKIEVGSAQMMINFFNCVDPIFQNANIRRAFTLAVTPEEFNNVLYSGARQPLYGIVTESVGSFRSVAGDPTKEIAESYAAQGITPKDLLLKGMEELGLGNDPKTLDITLKMGATTDFMRDYAAFFKQKWDDALGTDVKVSQTEWGVFADDYLNGRFQVAEVTWVGDYADPYATASIFTTLSNSLNSNYNNPEYDALVAEAKSEQDEAKRTQLYIQAEKMAMDDCVCMPLVAGMSSAFYKDYITGYDTAAFATTGYQFVDIQK